MPVTWVDMHHPTTGGSTRVPETAVAYYELRGWEPATATDVEQPRSLHALPIDPATTSATAAKES